MKGEKAPVIATKSHSRKSSALRKESHSQNNDREWLSYSQKIATQTSAAMEKKKLSQRELARRMNCSSQYISRLLKGKENLSLETICKLENALDESIIKSALID